MFNFEVLQCRILIDKRHAGDAASTLGLALALKHQTLTDVIGRMHAPVPSRLTVKRVSLCFVQLTEKLHHGVAKAASNATSSISGLTMRPISRFDFAPASVHTAENLKHSPLWAPRAKRPKNAPAVEGCPLSGFHLHLHSSASNSLPLPLSSPVLTATSHSFILRVSCWSLLLLLRSFHQLALLCCS